MLEFYRKHYMTKYVAVNLLDVVIAIIWTLYVYNYLIKYKLHYLLIVLLIVVWVKASLTVICTIKQKNNREAEN